MKRFRFPLRPVAVLRAHQELRAREAFAIAVQACAQAEQDLAATRARVSAFEAALRDGRGQAFSPSDQAQALTAYRREWLAEGEAERTVANARTAVQERRCDYVDAHRRLEVVRKLEDKARAAHRFETAREEQAAFDDFAGRTAGRRARLHP